MRAALRAASATEAQRAGLARELGVAEATLRQLIDALSADWRDPRDSLDGPLLLGSELRELSQMRVGQRLRGVVRNVTPFGAFVDVGLKDDGLVHISELAPHRVDDPHAVVAVGQAVAVVVVSVD
eukprot:770594-Prymnesium_polylepis.1